MLDNNNENQKTLNTILSTLIIFMMLPLAIRIINFNMTAILSILSIVSAFTAIKLLNLKTNNSTLLSHLFIIILLVSFSISNYLLKNENLLFIWLYLIPPFSFLLLSIRSSLVYSLAALVAILFLYLEFYGASETHTITRISVFWLFLVAANVMLKISTNKSRKEVAYLVSNLEKLVEEKTSDIEENYEETMSTITRLLEMRDGYTSGHSIRVSQYAVKLSQALNLPLIEQELVRKAGLLHDIGKIVTADNILLKPGRLNVREFDVIKQHPTVGYDLLINIPMYKDIAEIIHHHHERYDGTGYPSNLTGDEIPFLSQVLSIADAFDAMTSNRIYQSQKTVIEAIEELRDGKGKQFNSLIVDAACELFGELEIQGEIIKSNQLIDEPERFKYFYQDLLTGCFNMAYLQLFLNSKIGENYEFIYLLELKNFSEYNKMEGWVRGDKLLAEFSLLLILNITESQIFRFHGDDFIILSQREVSLSRFSGVEEFLSETVISCTCKNLKLPELLHLIGDINPLPELSRTTD